MSHEAQRHAINAIERLAFISYLRMGRKRVDAELLTDASEIEFKFNPYHDPRNGQFTFASGGVDRGGDSGTRNSRQATQPRRSQDAGSRSNGRYSFDGTLAAHEDSYDFDAREGRSAIGHLSTAVGRQLPGKRH